jgi:hypothetical protein
MDGDRFDAITRTLGRRSGRRALFGWAAATAAALAVRPSDAQGICALDGGLCPIGCYSGTSCAGCCGGHCGGNGVCARPGCMGYGCSCTVGMSFQCGFGLKCCAFGGTMYASGTCQYTCPWSG